MPQNDSQTLLPIGHDRTGWLKIMSICKYLTFSQVILNRVFDVLLDQIDRRGTDDFSSRRIARDIRS